MRRFWREDWKPREVIAGCRATWGVEPQPLHATVEWGGKRLEAASNIVFSNVSRARRVLPLQAVAANLLGCPAA